MIRTSCLSLMLVIFMAGFNNTFSQDVSYTNNKGLIIGFGTGLSYQTSDIKNSMGAGIDFRLGSTIFQKENALLSADWNIRFLAGENRAFDHRINTDGSYSNIRLKHTSYDIELGLILNRLREKTGIVVRGFAGLGLTHGVTATDLTDQEGVPYDYSSIDADQSPSVIKNSLVELSDGVFETPLTDKASILPAAGISLGYRLTPALAIGIEHKVNFSLSEDNSNFGLNIDNRKIAGSGPDMNHYTSIGIRWTLRKRASRDRYVDYYPPVKTSQNMQKPPSGNIPFGTTRTSLPRTNVDSLLKTIDHSKPLATSRSRHNEQTISNKGNTAVPVEEAVNNNVSAAGLQDNATVAGKSPVEVKPAVDVNPPEIIFINPASPMEVSNNIFTLKARINNVKEWNDLEVIINGHSSNNFSYTSDGMVNLGIALHEGANTIEIKARNDAGIKSGKTSLVYKVAPRAEEPLKATRINPGNSDWQFCLVTPYGTYNRSNLQDMNFSYSGSASSLFFKPIAGGGDALVNGKAYSLKPGTYYLFSGRLSVKLSSSNPGSMGQWSILIETDKKPVYGTGNNRPVSPCEQDKPGKKEKTKGDK